MSFDVSRSTFDPWQDYSEVAMEQGRVQTDADWNEWLSELSRRTRAGALDTLGHAVVPRTTPNAFKIDASTSGSSHTIRIGLGRMYVDGILVENHGPFKNATWDPALAELSNVPQPQPATPQTLDPTNSILFKDQPYNLGASAPAGPGQYVAYLDVWQRPVTYIEDPSLVDVAIGVDTTGRLQTAWRVSLLPLPGAAVAGSVTSGSFNPGDLVTQASTGATAIVIGAVPAAGPMMLSLVAGAPDATDVWSNTSGGQFTPTAAPVDSGSFIDGSVASGTFQSGEAVVQSSTGALATLSGAVPSAGPMIVGPISGAPAALAPWVGQTSGAVFTPASLPSGSSSTVAGAVSTGAFVANEQVVQNSTNASANLIGAVPDGGPMLIGAITGTPDATHNWVGQTSGATFAPGGAPVPSEWSCSTPDSSLPWPASSGTLTTHPVSSAHSGPCCLTTGGGYTGPENQFYRIEIHTPGGAGASGATFKWSRENASVQTSVTGIAAHANSLGAPSSALTVQSLGRDQVLGFAAGNWIEITDQTHDNNCLPGELYKIDFVVVATSSIVLTTPLSANFTPASLAANAYTRIVRWDQSGEVYKVVAGQQQPYYNLDASASASAPPNGCGGIPVPTDGSPIVLEGGIAISFGLSLASGSMQAMDYWNFTARTADGSIQELKNAPPRGVAHHYTKLSIVTFGVPSTPPATDCRILWPPPVATADGCCCTAVVSVGADIQKAIDSLPAAGGCVCLKAGLHELSKALTIFRPDVKLEGESPGTSVLLRGGGPALIIGDPTQPIDNPAQRIEVDGIDFESGAGGSSPAVIAVNYAQFVRIDRCAAQAFAGAQVFGIVINQSKDVAVTACIIAAINGGIWVTGDSNQDILLAGNAMHFELDESSAAAGVVGIVCDGIATGLHIAENVISGAYSGIVINDTLGGLPNSSATLVHVRDNNVTCVAAQTNLVGFLIGIDLAASQSVAENNVIGLPQGTDSHLGIRIAGWGAAAVGNTIYGYSPGGGPGTAPLGIQVGYPVTKDVTPTFNALVLNNNITSCLIGIKADHVYEGVIGGNIVEYVGIEPNATGIRLANCVSVQVERNQIDGYAFGVYAKSGLATRIAANIIGIGDVGVSLVVETGAVVSDNRIAVMLVSGILGEILLGRTDVVQNRISNCVLLGGGLSAIGVLGSFGMLRIAGNEVLDTGVSSAGNATPVCGIGALLVLEASVEGNQVTYSSPFTRDTTAEDRALIMCGLIELESQFAEGVPPVLGYPIQIIGNSFRGTGASALVQLLQFTIIPNFWLAQFERVTFNSNYCDHVSANAPPTGAATVKLVGYAANVVGNQMKSRTPINSVDFGGMLGLFIANFGGGPIANLGSASPAAGLNLS